MTDEEKDRAVRPETTQTRPPGVAHGGPSAAAHASFGARHWHFRDKSRATRWGASARALRPHARGRARSTCRDKGPRPLARQLAASRRTSGVLRPPAWGPGPGPEGRPPTAPALEHVDPDSRAKRSAEPAWVSGSSSPPMPPPPMPPPPMPPARRRPGGPLKAGSARWRPPRISGITDSGARNGIPPQARVGASFHVVPVSGVFIGRRPSASPCSLPTSVPVGGQ